MIKEHPILMSTPMVIGILEGRKTKTRRVVKLKDGFYDPYWSNDNKEFLCYKDGWGGNKLRCPYGMVGDQLWVRETWRKQSYGYADEDRNFSEYQYKASFPDPEYKNVNWRPSIFMPKDAARIWLGITAVTVERLQDITEKDAKDEGAEQYPLDDYYVQAFQRIWEKINGEKSWNENPWVWVITFKVLGTHGRTKIQDGEYCYKIYHSEKL